MTRLMIADQTWDALFNCLLWQGTALDEEGQPVPLDFLGFDRSDIHRDAETQVKAEFTEFVTENEALIEEYMDHLNVGMDQVAHDWILTRNGHGTGFWDRCYCGRDQAARELSELSRAAGEIGLHLGDDGWLHV